MRLLGLDIGSSSVKAGIFRGRTLQGRIVRSRFSTRYDGQRAEVDPQQVLRAIRDAVRELKPRQIDLIALAVMSPSWVALDSRGRALTPVITHQDRRSVETARQLELRIGKSRHLRLAGNRPFPGGISSTTWAWFIRHERALMRRADLVGHLDVLLHHTLTGARVTDPSHASFMGLYRTTTLGGWSDELCSLAGVSTAQLPEVRDASEIGGTLTADASRRLGIAYGTPVLVGITDTSSAMLLAGSAPGQLLNVSGSTDVLALCTDRPRPHERLLTRALGTGRRWMSVSTLASAGSTLRWVYEQLFNDLSWEQFDRELKRARRASAPATVRFEPYLAGDRTSIDQRCGAFTGLTLSTTRAEILAAVLDALADASAQRLELIRAANSVTPRRNVVLSGGTNNTLSKVLRSRWKGRWTFESHDEATLRGLAHLADR